MAEQIEFTEEEMEAFRKMMASLREDVKLACSSLKATLRSFGTGRSGDDNVNLPVQASSNAMELLTSSVGQVEPPASVSAIGESLRTAPLVPDDTKTAAHVFCSTECQGRDTKDLTPVVISEAAPKTPVTDVDTIPVLAVAPDLEPAFILEATPKMPVTAVETVPVLAVVSDLAPTFTSAAAPSPPVTTVDTVPVLEVAPMVQLQKLYNDSEFCKPSYSQHITSKVTLYRPLPTATMDIIPAYEAASDMGLDSKAISGLASTPATGSMVFLSRHRVATMLVEPPPSTRYLYGNSEFSRLSSTENITSKNLLHRPVPWPSFIVFPAAGDEARPLPWPSFTVIEKVSGQFSFDSASAITQGYPIHGGSGNMQWEIACTWWYVCDSFVQHDMPHLDRLQKWTLLSVEHFYKFRGLSCPFKPWTSGQLHFFISGTGIASSIYALLLCSKEQDELEMMHELSTQTDILPSIFCSLVIHNMRNCYFLLWCQFDSVGHFVIARVTQQEFMDKYNLPVVVLKLSLLMIMCNEAALWPVVQSTAGLNLVLLFQDNHAPVHHLEYSELHFLHRYNLKLFQLEIARQLDGKCFDYFQWIVAWALCIFVACTNLALIPLSKLKTDGVASVLDFLQVQGPARYQCCAHAFALVQNELKSSQVLLLPWVLEQKDFAIDFQFQLIIVIDDWCLMVRSVRLAFHIFALPIEKGCQNWRSWQSAISLDALLFLIKSVCLNYMDYWWFTTATLTEIVSIFSARFSIQMSGARFSTDHGVTAFLSSFLHQNGMARHIFSPCELAPMMKRLLEAWFTCVLPMCIEIKMESSQGSGGLFQCVPSYHLGKHFHNNTYGSDISSISIHAQFSKAGIQVSTTVVSWVPGALEIEANQQWGILWDPRGCIFARHRCEKWWTTPESTRLQFSDNIWWLSVLRDYVNQHLNRLVAWEVEDKEFSIGCGQAHSQEGRNAQIRVQLGLDCIAFLSQTSLSYDCYLDKAQSSTTFSDLITYHDDTNKIREVHRPWDPGKSAFRHPIKTTAWGQAVFQEGRNVMGLANILRVGLVPWASSDGLDPSKRSEATYTQEDASNTHPFGSRIEPLCSSSWCSSHLLPLAAPPLISLPPADCIPNTSPESL